MSRPTESGTSHFGEWQATFDAVNDAIWLLDQDFHIIRCNKATRAILGVEPNQVLGRHCWEVVHGTSAPIEECPIVRMKTTHCRESITLPLNGRWFQVTADPILDGKKRLLGAVHILSDITDRKHAEEETAGWRQRYELVASAARLIVYDCSAATGDISWGGGITSVLGYTSEQLSAGYKQWLELIHPDDLEATLRLYDEAERHNTPFEGEYRFRHKNGHYVLLRDRGYPVVDKNTGNIRFIGVMEDVTEQRRTEHALRESEILFRSLVENTPTGVWQDDAVKNAVYVNPALAAMLEINSLDEVQGQGLLRFFSEEGRQEIERQRVYREAGIASTYELESIGKRGTRRSLMVFGAPLLTSEGRYRGSIASVVDVTDRKKAEQQREILEAQLRLAQKMEAVGRLAGGVAHDFNNLLMVIQNYTDLARQTLPFSSPAWEALGRVTEAALQAAGVTRALLTFGRQVPAAKQPIDLRPVVESSVRMLHRTLPGSIRIVTDLPEKHVLGVLGDATQLQQVLMNLAINARDAMPEGGTLRITAAHARIGSGKDARPGIHLIVSDTGTGISPDIVEHVFDPFFSTKPIDKGTGLGLSVVHGIVKDHNGTVAVDPRPGKGAVFTIALPRYEGNIPDPSTKSVVPTPKGEGQLILLAEDHEQVRAVIRTALEALRYEVLCVSDGEALLDTYRRHRDRIAVLLTDFDMPKRNGLACIRTIREEGSQVPAILITASLEGEVELKLDEHTILVRKPFGVSQMADLVAGMVARRPEQAAAKRPGGKRASGRKYGKD